MRNRIGPCLICVTGCLIVATVWGVLAAFGTAQAGKPNRPLGQDQEAMKVDLVEDDWSQPFSDDFPLSPLWVPLASARTVGTGPAKYHFLFADDQDAKFVTSDGATLTSGVGCSVYLDKKGRVAGLKVRGQDVIGEEGIMHVSYDSAAQSMVLPIDPPVDPAEHTDANGVFTLHVHLDGIEIWKTDSHQITKKMELVEMVGTISIADIVFSPQP